MPATRVLQAVCEGRPTAAPGVDAFLVLDARATPPGRERSFAAHVAAVTAAASAAAGSGAGPTSASAFRNAFIFTVGGGSYAEYHDVAAYAAAAVPARTVVYGATEIVSAPALLLQLAQLGSRASR